MDLSNTSNKDLENDPRVEYLKHDVQEIVWSSNPCGQTKLQCL